MADIFNKMSADEVFEYAMERIDNKDEAEGVRALAVAAEKGNDEAMHRYGILLFIGKNVEKDEVKAAEYWQKAAENGHAASIQKLGVCYAEGFCGYQKDEKKAFELFKKSAEIGCPEALVSLARCYQQGIGVEPNEFEYAKYLKVAADVGQPEACLNVGMFYLMGTEKSEPDEETAFHYLLRAAEGGILPAQYVVGGCYEFGKGTERDCAEAAGWYRRAAKGGIPEANEALIRLGFPSIQ